MLIARSSTVSSVRSASARQAAIAWLQPLNQRYPDEAGAWLLHGLLQHERGNDAQARPIAGLYAAGNDMSSMMGGNYPSGGITLGPAMTFGFMAAHHAAGQPVALD